MPIPPFDDIDIENNLDIGRQKINSQLETLRVANNALEGTSVSTVSSLSGGGTLSGDLTLQLVNDVAAPGANRVYGTDGSGNRVWKPDPIEGLPAEFSGTTDTLSPAAGITSDFTMAIPYNRLYGISVSITGLSTDQTATVRFFGDSARTEEQYIADFTETLTEDNAQAWRYRSRAEDLTLYGSVENTGPTQIGVTITVIAEPF